MGSGHTARCPCPHAWLIPKCPLPGVVWSHKCHSHSLFLFPAASLLMPLSPGGVDRLWDFPESPAGVGSALDGRIAPAASCTILHSSFAVVKAKGSLCPLHWVQIGKRDPRQGTGAAWEHGCGGCVSVLSAVCGYVGAGSGFSGSPATGKGASSGCNS